VGLLLGFAHAAAAQTVDEIIEKHLAALGGRAALSKITTRAITGNITISTPGGDASGPIQVWNQAPNKARTLIELDLTALGVGKLTIDQRFNGSTGYVIDTLQGNRDIVGDQLEGMRNSVFPSPFLNYKETGSTIELAGKEKVGDREAYVLIRKGKTGPAVRHFIDAQNFAEIRQVVMANIPPIGEFEQTTDFLDFREVDGIKMPFQLKSSSSIQNFTVTMTKVEHNVKVDDAQFEKPAN
jgi:hypothetical protein